MLDCLIVTPFLANLLQMPILESLWVYIHAPSAGIEIGSRSPAGLKGRNGRRVIAKKLQDLHVTPPSFG